MEEFEINTDNILAKLQTFVKDKVQLDAHTWVDTAQKLNVLIGEEHDNLFMLEQKVAQEKVKLLGDGKTVAHAKVVLEATDLYREMQQQRAKIKQIEEMIRIAKIQARLKDNEYRQQ